MTHNLTKRINDLEQMVPSAKYDRVLELIDKGARYDELPDADKDLYCEYRGFNRQAKEEVDLMVLGKPDHDVLTRVPTKAECIAAREEVEKILFELQEPDLGKSCLSDF